jgi:ribosomal protein L7/L12
MIDVQTETVIKFNLHDGTQKSVSTYPTLSRDEGMKMLAGLRKIALVNKVIGIKAARAMFNCGLKDAEDLIEDLMYDR